MNEDQAPTSTLSAVARRAGVSTMTASRALRGLSSVKPATREKIRRAAEELGYPKRDKVMMLAAAREVRCGEGMRLVVPRAVESKRDSLNYFNQVFVDGLKTRLEKIGGRVDHVAFRNLADLMAICDRLRPAGMVLRNPLPVPWVEQIKRRLPVVSVMPCDIYQGLDSVYINEHRAAAQIHTHLRSLGHTRVAWVGVYDTNVPCELEVSGSDWQPFDAVTILASRYAAWATYTTAQLLRHRQAFLMFEHDHVNHSFDDVIRDIADEALALRPQPTALVVPSLAVAKEIYPVLLQRGLRIPQDISLVTYALQPEESGIGSDDWAADEKIRQLPRLTCISLNLEKVGRVIPELIERRAASSHAEPLSLQLEAPLLVGETSGPCRS